MEALLGAREVTGFHGMTFDGLTPITQMSACGAHSLLCGVITPWLGAFVLRERCPDTWVR
ncbi:MAG: hypothetical protein ACOVN7_02135 [Rubrivivax sp.]